MTRMIEAFAPTAIHPRPDWCISDMKLRVIEAGPACPSRGFNRNLDSHLEMLAREFSGQPYILYYHAYLIVHIRRKIDVRINEQKFKQLWRSEVNFLLSRLSLRWLVAAADTFCEYGHNKDGRSLAYAATLAVAITKLYETERFATSSRADRPDYDISRSGPGVQLFDGITAFSIGGGDIIYNLLQRAHKLTHDKSWSLDHFSAASFAKKWILDIWRTRAPVSVNALPVENRLLVEVLLRLCTHDTVFRRFADVHRNKHTRWRPRARRVALFNDTSTNGHYGCQAVMNSIFCQLERYDSEVIFVHEVGSDWRSNPNARRAIEECDLVIVNGEGSIHSSSKRATDLSEIGPYCRAKGVSAYLVNATLQNNNDYIYKNISEFTHVWVRDEMSGKTLTAQGIPHSYCADLSFVYPFPQSIKSPSKNLFLVDSVRGDVLKKLAKLSKKSEAPLYVMKENQQTGSAQLLIQTDPSKKVQFKDAFPCTGADGFIKLMAEHCAMITGRYHAVCFAISLRIPFSAYPSNTAKIEALIKDAGLNANRVLDLGCEFKSIQMPQPFSEAELASIEAFVQRQQASADLMFMKILNGHFGKVAHV